MDHTIINEDVIEINFLPNDLNEIDGIEVEDLCAMIAIAIWSVMLGAHLYRCCKSAGVKLPETVLA